MQFNLYATSKRIQYLWFNLKIFYSTRYIQLFWQEFYQLSTENEDIDPHIWQKVAQKLSWHNQLVLADFHEKYSINVEQKASAWFHITYKEELYNDRNMTNQRDRLYSFAWLVYPVLFHIYDHHHNDNDTDFEIRHKKRHKNRRIRRYGRGRKNRQKN
jgi:hypothetical protein